MARRALGQRLRRIRDMRRQVIAHAPKCDPAPEAVAAPTVLCIDGRVRKGVLILMDSGGCRWYRASGGCFMCSYSLGLGSSRCTSQALTDQFDRSWDKWESSNPEVVFVYPLSTIDPKETPAEVLTHILDRLSRSDSIGYVFLEGRPEHVTERVLNLINDRLLGKAVYVTMGLETVDDFVRTYCLNKGFTFNRFQRAVLELREAGLRSAAFIALKPPFLTELEAIEDTVRTITTAWEFGILQFFLMAINVAGGSVVAQLHKAGLYRPAWLWSIVEVLNRLPDHIRSCVQVAGYQGPRDIPGPDDQIAADYVFGATFSYLTGAAHNCGHCDEKIKKALDSFNAGTSWQVYSDTDCHCRQTWEEALSIEAPPLTERICQGYDLIVKSGKEI